MSMTVDEAIKFSEQELASLDPGLADRALEVLAAEVRRLRQEVKFLNTELICAQELGKKWEGLAEANLILKNIENDKRREYERWQPIETAPRDGTRILLYRPLAERTKDESIDIKRGVPSDRGCWAETIPKGLTGENYTDGACRATHWMRLPSAPK